MKVMVPKTELRVFPRDLTMTRVAQNAESWWSHALAKNPKIIVKIHREQETLQPKITAGVGFQAKIKINNEQLIK